MVNNVDDPANLTDEQFARLYLITGANTPQGV